MIENSAVVLVANEREVVGVNGGHSIRERQARL